MGSLDTKRFSSLTPQKFAQWGSLCLKGSPSPFSCLANGLWGKKFNFVSQFINYKRNKGLNFLPSFSELFVLNIPAEDFNFFFMLLKLENMDKLWMGIIWARRTNKQQHTPAGIRVGLGGTCSLHYSRLKRLLEMFLFMLADTSSPQPFPLLVITWHCQLKKKSLRKCKKMFNSHGKV